MPLEPFFAQGPSSSSSSPAYPTLATAISIPMPLPTTSNPTDKDGIKCPIPIINQMIYYLYPLHITHPPWTNPHFHQEIQVVSY
jgi:hypothetical protein